MNNPKRHNTNYNYNKDKFMRKTFNYLVIGLIAILLVSCQSKEEKAAEYIKNELSKTLYDFDSYQPIETNVTVAKMTMYNDSACRSMAADIAEYMKEYTEFLEEAKSAEEHMDIWARPTYYSSSYSDDKYYYYKKIYEDNLSNANFILYLSERVVAELNEKIAKLDTAKVIGWEVKHRFRCKTKGGNSTIADYRYVLDKDFKNTILQEDIDDEDDISIRAALKFVANEKVKDSQPALPASAPNPTSHTTCTLTVFDWVDLGLSVKWATKNVGASSPSDYGDYFAWGETRTKYNYTWENCFDCLARNGWGTDDGWSTYKIGGKTSISPTSGHDTARENWGGTWRMPTYAEFEELWEKCYWTWTSQDGHNGYLVTSKINGNSIFLPAAGWCYDTNLSSVGEVGFYWSSTLGSSYSYNARCLRFYSSDRYTDDGCCRRFGQSVRPVTE